METVIRHSKDTELQTTVRRCDSLSQCAQRAQYKVTHAYIVRPGYYSHQLHSAVHKAACTASLRRQNIIPLSNRVACLLQRKLDSRAAALCLGACLQVCWRGPCSSKFGVWKTVLRFSVSRRDKPLQQPFSVFGQPWQPVGQTFASLCGISASEYDCQQEQYVVVTSHQLRLHCAGHRDSKRCLSWFITTRPAVVTRFVPYLNAVLPQNWQWCLMCL